jgi:transcription termination factor Rho
MTERRRPTRRGRGPRPQNNAPTDSTTDSSPYREDAPSSAPVPSDEALNGGSTEAPVTTVDSGSTGNAGTTENTSNAGDGGNGGSGNGGNGGGGGHHQQHGRRRGRDKEQRESRFGANGRRGRRGRGRNSGGQRSDQHGGPPQLVVADGTAEGWFDSARDGGFIRSATDSYLPTPGDPFVPPQLARQYALRRGDLVRATVGRDHRGRTTAVDIELVNGAEPSTTTRRPDFSSLIASYPERKLVLETGKPAKVGPELTRRAIDLIAPIGYGQRALIVAPARAGKTMLLQAITEGIAINHPEAVLLVLLVDERPEEVSEMISWGRGEVVASSFDQPAERHVDVAEMVLERARRLVESGRDVVIVLDSLTRLARAHNTVERGTGRTLSGGLDATAMAKPKAFFGSARSVAPEHGGGSLTIIATALVETGSRMDDVIFEEFKGTGNCEIKLDRSLAEKRIYPAIDIGTSGTRREDKLFKPEQLDAVYTLRRGLQQMPPQAAMEWLIKRIGSTPNNDALLEGL